MIQENKRMMIAHHLLFNFRHRIKLSYINPLMAAIDSFDRGNVYKKIKLPIGIERTAGEIVAMFELENFTRPKVMKMLNLTRLVSQFERSPHKWRRRNNLSNPFEIDGYTRDLSKYGQPYEMFDQRKKYREN